MEVKVECFDRSESYEYPTDNVLIAAMQALHDFSQDHKANFFATDIRCDDWVLDNTKTNPFIWQFVTEAKPDVWQSFLDDHDIEEIRWLVETDDYKEAESYIQEWRSTGQTHSGP